MKKKKNTVTEKWRVNFFFLRRERKKSHLILPHELGICLDSIPYLAGTERPMKQASWLIQPTVMGNPKE